MREINQAKYTLVHILHSVMYTGCLFLCAFTLSAQENASISPYAIEIDKGAAGANLYPESIGDWVNEAASWRGVHIVDGVAGSDADMFLSGGKENDPGSWQVGSGSIGSSKYDIVQSYVANNREKIFFGMERRGNNGTTAFDFEFNQAPPVGWNETMDLQFFVPTRTINDVLVTFELTSSGVTTYHFVWNGTAFVRQEVAGVETSINVQPVLGPPWGTVNNKGTWVPQSSVYIDRYQFAEASANLKAVFGESFDTCGGAGAWMQVRTRSSAVDTSDLKDTTPIRHVKFGGPTAMAEVRQPDCRPTLHYSGKDSTDSAANANSPILTYSWTFSTKTPGVSLSQAASDAPEGNITVDFGAPGANLSLYKADIDWELTITEDGICRSTISDSVVVYRPLEAAITKKTPIAKDLSVELLAVVPGGRAALLDPLSPVKVTWRLGAPGKGADLPMATGPCDVGNSLPDPLTLVYSTFSQDDLSPEECASGAWKGLRWDVQVYLHVERTLNGQPCTADSEPVVVSKITVVDP